MKKMSLISYLTIKLFSVILGSTHFYILAMSSILSFTFNTFSFNQSWSNILTYVKKKWIFDWKKQKCSSSFWRLAEPRHVFFLSFTYQKMQLFTGFQNLFLFLWDELSKGKFWPKYVKNKLSKIAVNFLFCNCFVGKKLALDELLHTVCRVDSALSNGI